MAATSPHLSLQFVLLSWSSVLIFPSLPRYNLDGGQSKREIHLCMHYNNNRVTIAKYKFHLTLRFGVQNYIIKPVQSTTREGTIYCEAGTLGRERTAEELSHTLHNPTPLPASFPRKAKNTFWGWIVIYPQKPSVFEQGSHFSEVTKFRDFFRFLVTFHGSFSLFIKWPRSCFKVKSVNLLTSSWTKKYLSNSTSILKTFLSSLFH